MLRIIGGTFRGRALQIPPPSLTRPTTDRARESLFNILAHRFSIEKDCFLHANILDIYAGSGSLGLEALSRGAAFCAFLEKSSVVQKILKQNIETLGVQDRTTILPFDAASSFSLPSYLPFTQFDLVFIDPPYAKDLANPPLVTLYEKNLIHDASLLVVEIQKKESVPDCIGKYYTILDDRIYGQGRFFFLRKA